MPGFIFPVHRDTNTTLVPPSKRLYFPPLRGPAGVCPLSNSAAWSLYPSSTTDPLSLVRITIVFLEIFRLSRQLIISPTDQSNSRIASPRGPIPLFPTN